MDQKDKTRSAIEAYHKAGAEVQARQQALTDAKADLISCRNELMRIIKLTGHAFVVKGCKQYRVIQTNSSEPSRLEVTDFDGIVL